LNGAVSAVALTAAGHNQSDTALGSKASYNPSPKKLKAITATLIVETGANHQRRGAGHELLSERPQVPHSGQVASDVAASLPHG